MKKTMNLRRWLEHCNSLALFLPDGPYGRPFDNRYFFQDVSQSEHEICIDLSDNITLRFDDNAVISKSKGKILISGYKYLDFVLDGNLVKSYTGGEACLRAL